MKECAVYMLTNQSDTVLYIGVTNNLLRRVLEHKCKRVDGFASKYNCTKLVYFEIGEYIEDAIIREKQLKNWHRDWKNNLISDFNPSWKDLSCDIGITDEMLRQAQHDTSFFGAVT